MEQFIMFMLQNVFETTPTAVQALVFMAVLIVPIFISAFVSRFRSWMAGLFNFIAILAIINFLLGLEALQSFWNCDNQFMPYIVKALEVVSLPINSVNYLIGVKLAGPLTRIGVPSFLLDMLYNEIFYLCVWVILGFIVFLIFKKRRHKRREYDDYDE